MRLIDADRALEIVRDQRIAHPNAYHLTNYATLILQEAPTIEAEPVRHGRWIKHHNYFQGFYENTDYKCSVCGLEREWLGGANYCPNCGARMDLEDVNESY